MQSGGCTTHENHSQFWDTWNCKVELLTQAIWYGMAVALSNGSFRDQLNAAAWTLKGTMVEHQLSGTRQTPSCPEDQSTYLRKLFCPLGNSCIT